MLPSFSRDSREILAEVDTDRADRGTSMQVRDSLNNSNNHSSSRNSLRVADSLLFSSRQRILSQPRRGGSIDLSFFKVEPLSRTFRLGYIRKYILPGPLNLTLSSYSTFQGFLSFLSIGLSPMSTPNYPSHTAYSKLSYTSPLAELPDPPL